MKVIFEVKKELNYPLVKFLEKETREVELPKDFFKDVRVIRKNVEGKDIIFVSLKKNKEIYAGSRLLDFLKQNQIEEVWVDLKNVKNSRELIEGILLTSYEFLKYKKEKEKEIRINLIGNENLEKELKIAKIIYEGVKIARDLTNEPANKLTPQNFVNYAIEILDKFVNVKIRVYDEKELEKGGFNGILAVGKGSQNKPRLLIIHYKNAEKKPIVLIGKGVCFDAGGLNLKPSGYIEEMKMDMGGAAVVLGVIYTAANLNLNLNLVGIIPLVENVPSSTSTKPGDIIKMFDGKTVEIVNTDAEGRLIVADSIAFAEKEFKPEYIIDIATLTGAQIVSLGYRIGAIFSNDKDLRKELIACGRKTKEYLWPLPLPKFYEEDIKGEISDLKNLKDSKSRDAGCIIGALFLKQFVKKAKWAHLDLAGPIISPKKWEWYPKGGSGFGVRLLIEWLKRKEMFTNVAKSLY